MNLQQKTERLLAVCRECFERHAQMRELNREPDFFIEVKPYADQYHTLLDEWTGEVSEFIKTEKPKYVHPVQIESLNDSMKQFIVQSFYQKTGKKRFVLSINSAEYTFKTILDAIEVADKEKRT
ncbi:YppE family protein [Sporosarcina sp. YIM B06819]|uniref:YppE family protein n=1 Tax=Sporosarcina sp. YIM B06819 TaxID=3081769 RepID=UPI00298CFE8A|nr:YppE family protein [Sporosarcina sp. YIM B06819]